MKKLVVSAAAAVALMASPLAGGTADAAQPNSGQQNGKVYYFYQTGDFSKMNDWCKQPYHKFTPKKKLGNKLQNKNNQPKRSKHKHLRLHRLNQHQHLHQKNNLVNKRSNNQQSKMVLN